MRLQTGAFDAQDLTQAFFAMVLEKHSFSVAEIAERIRNRYPTVVLREPRILDPKKADGVPEVQYLSTALQLDFDAEMPDSLFTTAEWKTP